MQFSVTIAAVLSSAAFILYGASLFGSRAMAAEFERYRLAPYRTPRARSRWRQGPDCSPDCAFARCC